MASVDIDTWVRAHKALTVIFIVLIVLANLFLLYKIIRAAGDLQRLFRNPRAPRFQIFIGLILGDILVALFSLVVAAMEFFAEKTVVEDLSCRSIILAVFYLQFIMPFTYGMGLVALAIECICFRKWPRLAWYSLERGRLWVIVSVVAGALPWIWSLCVALPLTIEGVDFDACDNKYTVKRIRAIICVCMLAPAVAAFTSAFANLQMSYSPVEHPVELLSVQGHTNTGCIPPAPPTAAHRERPLLHGNARGDFLNLQPGLANPQADIAHNQRYQPGLHSHQLQLSGALPGYGQPYHNQPFSHENRQQLSVQVSDSSPETLPDPCPDEASMTQTLVQEVVPDFGREVKSLIVAALLFCVCVLPFAIYQLAFVYNDHRGSLDSLAAMIFNELVYWMVVLRSALLPVMWAFSGTLRSD